VRAAAPEGRPTVGASRATFLFCVLFAAALAAAVLVAASRSPELVLEVRGLPDLITPDGDGARDNAEISFFVRETDAEASVHIVDRDLALVRTLDSSASLAKEEPVTYLWDGTTDAGKAAPTGHYRLRVVLPSSDREMVFPKRIELRRPPPPEPEATG